MKFNEGTGEVERAVFVRAFWLFFWLKPHLSRLAVFTFQSL